MAYNNQSSDLLNPIFVTAALAAPNQIAQLLVKNGRLLVPISDCRRKKDIIYRHDNLLRIESYPESCDALVKKHALGVDIFLAWPAEDVYHLQAPQMALQ